MNKEYLNFFLNEPIQINLITFVESLILAGFLSFIIQITYLKFSTSLSNKFDFSKNFIILGLTTTLVITIVKSSLALSLGLVGALSIVRFRAAIKEPEELVYLFIIIAIGLGCGAGQVKIVTSGIVFTLIIIGLYSFYYQKKKQIISEILNLAISKNKSVSEKEINLIVQEIKKCASKVDLISITKSKDNTTMNFDIVISNFEKINNLTNKIEKKKFKVIIARNDINSI